MTSDARPRLAYRPELDGVRAIAVLAVLGFHLGRLLPSFTHFVSGGFLGVDIFFVLSGMLITELLVNEHLTHGTVSLRSFYRRRARRLLPALVALLVLAISYYQLVHGIGFETIKELGAVSLYATTGQLRGPIGGGVSQVWTLVVEWEFYLIWPVVLAALLRSRLQLRTLAYAVATVAVIVAIAAALLFHTQNNWFLGYYLAWRRSQELLIGCAIGLLGSRPQAPSWLRSVALGAMAVIVFTAVYNDHWLYLGGMLGLSVATATVVQPRVAPWSIDRFLASRPMVWTGKLSYSLYLWSAPVTDEIGRYTSWPTAVQVLVSVIVSFALASASYYLVERRFRLPSRGALSDPSAPSPASPTPASMRG